MQILSGGMRFVIIQQFAGAIILLLIVCGMFITYHDSKSLSISENVDFEVNTSEYNLNIINSNTNRDLDDKWTKWKVNTATDFSNGTLKELLIANLGNHILILNIHTF